ncbi:FxSxx-COOH system tetratricopeptide repeat protein [Streptomyces longwoodensis]|uniref:FxSxx-COOH system tetratricopeptide repeat protein n=1 Tax=Streptomyces longwoodensis TaxID=68231 RepID=UPI00340E664A
MRLFPWLRRRKDKPDAYGADGVAQRQVVETTVSAGTGGVAAGGQIKGSALGAHSSVTYAEHLYMTDSEATVHWPVVVGTVPVRASAFQPRSALRRAVDDARSHGRTVVLASDSSEAAEPAPAERTPVQVMTGGGGVGKSQLAAAYARDAVRGGTDLVLWIPASETQQILTAYARAALLVRAPGRTGEDRQADARAFLDWLAATDRRWLVVLDDITDLDAVEAWWPDSQRGTGWVLATTRLKDPRLTGGGRTRVDVDVYTPTEAAAYLTTRLTDDRKPHLLDDQAPALAQALGYLPLALGHAAAYMLRENTPCTAYLKRFAERAARLDELLPRWADTERYGRQITTTLLLALDATDKDPLGPLARTALNITALLDPAGHPATLWHTNTLTAHLTQTRYLKTPHRLPGRHTALLRPVTGDDADAALRLLDRYALITCETADDQYRAVRMHALTARAVRETVPEGRGSEIAVAAADALLELWPEIDQPYPDLAATLRANTDALASHAGDLLWRPDAHLVLFRAGISLFNAGLAASGVSYWQHMTASSERFLGSEHPDTLTARGNLANSYRQAGRTGEAIAIEERVLVDSERLLGGEHPDTLTARANLANSYWQAGRTGEAIEIEERVLADSERLLGSEHPDTLTSRANLAVSYREAGRTGEAIELLEQVVADRERLLGVEHPDTLTARGNLAASYRQAGRTGEAIEIEERVLGDFERLLGVEHPDTLTARSNLAASYRQAGRTGEAIEIEERVLADFERLLGVEHPDALTVRANLGNSYWQAGRTGEAIELLERVLADFERLLGVEHPDTLTARSNLAGSYWQAGRTGEAIELLEGVLADFERLLGGKHPDTLTARSNLAGSYWQAGRTGEAIELLEQVVADRERLLGGKHPDTLTARANLTSLYQQTAAPVDKPNK